MSPVRPSCAVRLACRCAHVGSCAPLPRRTGPADRLMVVPGWLRRVGGAVVAQVRLACTVRLACRYRRVGSCAPAWAIGTVRQDG